MKFALISDCHCWAVNVFPWRLFGKRALGMSNLILFRIKSFNSAVTKRAICRIQELNPDKVIFSGDATQSSLPVEFRKARQLFEPIFEKLIAVPGNHDYYTFGAIWNNRFDRIFLNHKKCTKESQETQISTEYPWVKKYDDNIKIIGLNGAYPNFQAYGRIPKNQLKKLENEIEIASDLKENLIIVHHFNFEYPENIQPKANHRLLNANKLIEVLKKGRKIIYIHGHIHKSWIIMSKKVPNVLCINAAACGLRTKKQEFGLGFYELLIQGSNVEIFRHTPISEFDWQKSLALEIQNFFD